jgi:L1 cell adhesion molecule like protein
LRKLFDPTLVEESQLMEIERCVNIGLLCSEFDPKIRPTMADVLEMLNGKKELPARKK